jgi:hypothetical protein
MDDDVTINSASFVSSVPSNGALNGTGPWSLATNQSLNAGASHVYTLTVNVGLNLAGGGGNDVYDRCLPTPDGAPNQGLFNRATLTQPGQPGRDADACGDVPGLNHDKEFVSATAAAGVERGLPHHGEQQRWDERRLTLSDHDGQRCEQCGLRVERAE